MLAILSLLKGFGKNPMFYLKCGLAVILVTVAAIGYRQWSNAKSDLDEALGKNTLLEDSNALLTQQIIWQRGETIRINGLLLTAINERKDAEVIYVDRYNKVIEYKNDPNVRHCNLDVKWMQLANEAAVSPYPSGKN